jgi:hypothetical protein
LVDRVLYLVDGRFRIGTPEEVMTSPVLSELYRTQVDVLRVRGRLVVVGTGDTMDALGTAGGHCHGPAGDEFAPGGSAPDGSPAATGATEPGDPTSVGSQADDQATDRSPTAEPVTNGAAPTGRTPSIPAPAHPASGRSPNLDVAAGTSTSTDPRPGEPATNGSTGARSTSGGRERAAQPSAHPAPSGTTSDDPAADRTIPGNGKAPVAAASQPHAPADLPDGSGDRSAEQPDESGVRS